MNKRAILLLLLLLMVIVPALSAPSLNLKRLRVGHQAGILKVYAPDLKTVNFIKASTDADPDVLGIDGVKFAPLSGADRDALLAALEIAPGQAEAVASKLMQDYARLPHLEAVALLGALATPGNATALSPATSRKIVRFLQARLTARETVQVRRQAVLSLALIPGVDFAEVAAVINFMKASRNGWETFTTTQFFEYHKVALASMERLPEIKQRLMKSGSPHAENILSILGN